ncbi:enoyl-CoA hydratase/isomerase family protein [Yinghuangia seranimata]|uniref:enoyl-CoA hydratase/isomerase family protein n=1 Tax=Yinghuangia seranimata TaxID=408067 RepID=UPI00248C9103|nr:enoyl-CoA hydratase/isomerase family protein [Yinghuangia seranimata]MDI2126334.1 enoyl-CoA hydratase/isomerase family protein [Yinghuangia seranimata]
MSENVRLELTGPLAVVTLANPDRRNAQTPATWRDLAGVGRSLPGDVRAVVLRGEGSSFSAGLDRRLFPGGGGVPGEADLADLATRGDAEVDETIAEFQEAFTWWRRPDLVSIAAVQGHAVGAGFQLALACDLRVCADDVQFCMLETSLGLVPDLAGTKPLVDLVGYARALEICVTGRRIGAAEAAALGLANQVVPRAELDEAALGLAKALTAAPRDAVVETKALLRGAAERTYDEQRAAEREAQGRRLKDLLGAGE